MIHILLLIPTLDRSGAEKQLTLLAQGLPREEFQVEVVCLSRGGPYQAELEAAGITVTVIGKSFRFDPVSLLRLRRLVARRKPDILHTWLFAANSSGRLIVNRKHRPDVIVSERCVDTWKSRWQLWLDRQLIPRTTQMIGNSQAVVDFYGDAGIPADRLTVIRNGIEIPEQPNPGDVSRLREEFGIGESSQVLGAIGRLAPQKRFKDLLWAFELVCSHDLDVHLVIAGDGPQRSELEAFARQIRVADRVSFAGHRDDATSLLPLLDVYWLASEFEGQSNSLMEAMAAARPVVVSDIAPNLELVSHEETGLVVPVTDRAEFAKAALRLLRDRASAERLGTAARDRMSRDFPVSRMIAAHAELYRRVVESSDADRAD